MAYAARYRRTVVYVIITLIVLSVAPIYYSLQGADVLCAHLEQWDRFSSGTYTALAMVIVGLSLITFAALGLYRLSFYAMLFLVGIFIYRAAVVYLLLNWVFQGASCY